MKAALKLCVLSEYCVPDCVIMYILLQHMIHIPVWKLLLSFYSKEIEFQNRETTCLTCKD